MPLILIDGIDGLLGGLSIVSFAAIGILMFRDGQMDMAYWSFGLIVAILPYLLLNLGIPFGPKYKVFMGDAGSTFNRLYYYLDSTFKYTRKRTSDESSDRTLDYCSAFN